MLRKCKKELLKCHAHYNTLISSMLSATITAAPICGAELSAPALFFDDDVAVPEVPLEPLVDVGAALRDVCVTRAGAV